MTNVIQITPFMHARSLKEAIEFFELLGFEVLLRASDYAYLEREGAGMRVLQSTREDGAAFESHRGFAYYLDVRDVGAIVAETRAKLEAAGVEFRGVVDQPYGQREFMVRAPDGNLFVFGQAIRSAVWEPDAAPAR